MAKSLNAPKTTHERCLIVTLLESGLGYNTVQRITGIGKKTLMHARWANNEESPYFQIRQRLKKDGLGKWQELYIDMAIVEKLAKLDWQARAYFKWHTDEVLKEWAKKGGHVPSEWQARAVS